MDNVTTMVIFLFGISFGNLVGYLIGVRDRRIVNKDPNTNFSGKPQDFGDCYHDTKKEMTKEEWRTV